MIINWGIGQVKINNYFKLKKITVNFFCRKKVINSDNMRKNYKKFFKYKFEK